MSNLSIQIDIHYINNELIEYLLNLKGVYDIKINEHKKIIDVTYDNNAINISVLKMEIFLFLNILKIPSILSFSKHPKSETLGFQMIIKDLCCEYCFKYIIEELFLINGIESVFSDFDYNCFNYNKNIKIDIKYNPKLINKDKLLNLEEKFNF